ncbi:MAG: RidA family protein [Chitinophagales bacterium]
MKRQNISSNTKWESIVGYSRAVRIGNIIEVAGTTAVDGETVIAPKDAYKQTKFIFNKIAVALKEAGAGLQDVVRTRMFVTDIAYSDGVGRAHSEFFSEIRPAATMLEISKLVDDDLVVEIEVTAILG